MSKLEQIRNKINYSIGIFEGYTQHHKNKGDDVKADANEGHAKKLKEALKLLDELREDMELYSDEDIRKEYRESNLETILTEDMYLRWFRRGENTRKGLICQDIKELVSMLEYYAETNLESLYNNSKDFTERVRGYINPQPPKGDR